MKALRSVGAGLALATLATVIPLAPSSACSPALAAHRAMMGRPPDCFDSNTAAIVGPRQAKKPPAVRRVHRHDHASGD